MQGNQNDNLLKHHKDIIKFYGYGQKGLTGKILTTDSTD